MQRVESSRTSSSWRAQAVFPSTVTEAQTTSELTWGPAALEQRRQRTREHLARIAPRREGWIKRNSYYYKLLSGLLRFLVEPQKQVLSVRCGTGNLLAAVEPSGGKGIDICDEMVDIAQQRNPSLNFAVAFPDKDEFRQKFRPGETFDYILFNDIGDTVDVLQAFRNLKAALSAAYSGVGNNVQSSLGTTGHFRGVDRDESAAHRAELAFHGRHSEFVEASRL